MVNVDGVWARIRTCEGQQFRTLTGIAFTYEVPGNYLRILGIDRNLSRTNFSKAIELMPADGPGQLQGRQGASPWQTKADQPTVEDAEAVIFVDLTGETPDFHVAPASWVREDVRTHHAAWLDQVGGSRPRTPESDHTAIPVERIQRWHRSWDVLIGDGGGQRP